MFKGYKPPGMTPWSEGGTRVPRERAQCGVEINGPTQHSKGEALIQTQDGWLDPRTLYTVALIVGPALSLRRREGPFRGDAVPAAGDPARAPSGLSGTWRALLLLISDKGWASSGASPASGHWAPPLHGEREV